MIFFNLAHEMKAENRVFRLKYSFFHPFCRPFECVGFGSYSTPSPSPCYAAVEGKKLSVPFK
jgi:hypothetical protein